MALGPPPQLCKICNQDLGEANANADARITRLAGWIEDQIEHAVFPDHLHQDLKRIIEAGRKAAQWQPDGTKVGGAGQGQLATAMLAVDGRQAEDAAACGNCLPQRGQLFAGALIRQDVSRHCLLYTSRRG